MAAACVRANAVQGWALKGEGAKAAVGAEKGQTRNVAGSVCGLNVKTTVARQAGRRKEKLGART